MRNFTHVFIYRPVATSLLTIGLMLTGLVGYLLLPVARLPDVDFPTISVSAQQPGASPETMAATVATPLERALGQIAGITEMTSNSSLGSTNVSIQFELDRDINGAARDVQAAINAALPLLPSGLSSRPKYRKANISDSPTIILAMTSDTMSMGDVYDVADNIVAQRLSQVEGVGQVTVGGGSKPAVRVEVNPTVLNKYGIGIEAVRTAIGAANANRPKGSVSEGERSWQIYADDQTTTADQYRPLIVAYRNDAAVRIGDVAEVTDSVQDLRNAGYFNSKPAILLILFRQPNSNVIEVVNRVNALLPVLRASLPSSINLELVADRSPSIRTALREVERTLIIAVILVILVVFVFLRNTRATLIPAVAVPVSLIGSLGFMYLSGFSLNLLSLMALTVATGFVVDDAIVVLENVTRHIESGMRPFQAALRGAKEVSFTVLSMSLSLIAVFIPVLMMGGIVGRLLREFAVTLSVCIVISLVLSVTLTPMMCARLLRAPADRGLELPTGMPQGKSARAGARSSTYFGALRNAVPRIQGLGQVFFDGMLRRYERSLNWALRFGPLMMLILLGTVALNLYLYTIVPKGLFPRQDTGRLMGFLMTDQSASFQARQQKLLQMMKIVQSDPEVTGLMAFMGGMGGQMFVNLKPISERSISADAIIARIRAKAAHVPGANLFLNAQQDIRIGGRQSNAEYQFTLLGDEVGELREWEKKIRVALSNLDELVDVNTDTQDNGVQTSIVMNRDAAAQLGMSSRLMDATLNDLFGQRQVSTIYKAQSQYKVVLEAAPQYWQSAEALNTVYFSGPTGAQVPLSAFATVQTTKTSLGVNHQGQFAASTISFNLPEGVSMSQATTAINNAMSRLGVPSSIHGAFAGSANVFQASLKSQPILILVALLTVYIVLGVLYESLIHPLTILSTLPSAGVGALLALLVTGQQFTIIALIAVILLIGIVKKNAIMMIDFAIDAERTRGLSPRDAIFEACRLRFRPIMMTTMAALFGALPLALATGEGVEMRRPLGIAIVGGLLLSQLLTLYTTPVVYLYLDRFQIWLRGSRGRLGSRLRERSALRRTKRPMTVVEKLSEP